MAAKAPDKYELRFLGSISKMLEFIKTLKRKRAALKREQTNVQGRL